MGVDYHAYAVIGCEVTGKLYDEVKVKSCTCQPMAPDARFCQHCGRSTKPSARRVAKSFYNESNDTIGSLTVSFTTDRMRAFVGLRSKVSSNREMRADIWPITNSAMFVDTVRAELEKYGLWDPNTFGLWAVMYCSY